jgi:hypothetical protein
MNDEPFNSERQQAERLDEWITAAQADNSSDHDTVGELRRLVQIGRAIRTDETFAHQLETQLIQRHRQRRPVNSWRWVGLAAAVIIAIFLGVFRTVEQRSPTNTTIPATRPIALAATSTAAVEIDRTESALLVVPPTKSPIALAATSTVAVEINWTESAMQSTLPPSVDATIVPAINPTVMPSFPPAQVDVLFAADSNVAVKELENSIDDLPSQILSLPGQPDTQFGLVVANENSVQTVDFGHDIGMIEGVLQTAETGSTWTEIVDEAVTGVSWRENATVKVIIGFAGTRPCIDCITALRTAASQNITLYIVVLGEMDEQDEAGFREMAQITGGQLIVLDDIQSGWIVQLIRRQLADLRSG